MPLNLVVYAIIDMVAKQPQSWSSADVPWSRSRRCRSEAPAWRLALETAQAMQTAVINKQLAVGCGGPIMMVPG